MFSDRINRIDLIFAFLMERQKYMVKSDSDVYPILGMWR